MALTRKPTFNIQANKADMGLGWFIQKKIEEEWIMHNGGTGGYRSNMVLDIANKNGVIILSNISAAHKNSMNIDNLGTRLMGTLKKSHLMAQQ